MTPAALVLEDGRIFYGRRFGAFVPSHGEVVFNTAMSGYQEVLGDPSYAKQIVVMTYPMQGNYGIGPDDFESRGSFVAGFVVKEPSRIASNWRHDRSLDAFLRQNSIAGLCDLDTRALTRHLRDRGVLRAVIVDAETTDVASQQRWIASAKQVPCMQGLDLARVVTTSEVYTWDKPSPLAPPPKARAYRVVVVDYGVKQNILRRLVDVGCEVTVVPATYDATQILALKPDGVVLSNGPGDPTAVTYGVQAVQSLLGRVPLFGICLGHQLLCLAVGAKSFKLKFGHRGANHPVRDVSTGRVEITSQNHGFCVDPASLDTQQACVTHINLNDNTLEGIALKHHPAFSVQYHPEAAPGPQDAAYLFARFCRMMDTFKRELPLRT